MPVLKGSRYEGVKFTGIVGLDCKVRKFLHAREPLTTTTLQAPLIVHPFQAGEVIDELAWKATGKPRLWWMIADVNDIIFPLEIEPGTEVIVPLRQLTDKPELG